MASASASASASTSGVKSNRGPPLQTPAASLGKRSHTVFPKSLSGSSVNSPDSSLPPSPPPPSDDETALPPPLPVPITISISCLRILPLFLPVPYSYPGSKWQTAHWRRLDFMLRSSKTLPAQPPVQYHIPIEVPKAIKDVIGRLRIGEDEALVLGTRESAGVGRFLKEGWWWRTWRGRWVLGSLLGNGGG
ncbi:hypothetical protein RUND412_008336 [Rhizina undulata]